VSEPLPEIGGLRAPGGGVSPLGAGLGAVPGTSLGASVRELFVRHARKDGRSVAVLRAVDHGDSCVVEAEVYPATGAAGAGPTRPGPYTFASAHEATAFVTEAVEALMYLGCDITAE
jgi:hypothetical protein